MIASIPLQDVVFGRFGPTIAIAADAATLRAGDLWFDLDFKEQSGSAARAPGGGRVPVLSAASFAATVAVAGDGTCRKRQHRRGGPQNRRA
jgi:hypothetical protein